MKFLPAKYYINGNCEQIITTNSGVVVDANT